MNTLMFAIVGWFAATASGAPHRTDPDCGRYLDAMRKPDVVAMLEDWHARLPKTFDEKKYPRVLESSGFGAYSIALDFDPAPLGLGQTAHAEISIEPATKRIRFAAISDAPDTGFVFRFEGHERSFDGRAMKSPRSEHVGVACWTPRGE